MPSVTVFKYRFTPSWLMIVLAGFVMILFLRLGFWQLHRADEKKHMVQAQALMAKMNAISWDAGSALPQQYQNLQVQGHYVPQVFLLDNQHQEHQFGYDVLTPLELGDGSIVMIDRGWVAGDNARQRFPDVVIPQGLVHILGAAYFPSSNQWLLGPGMEKKDNKVYIFEQMDVTLWRQILQKPVHPFIIRLDKKQAYGYSRQWTIVSMPPQRHLAYALQWFVMALVIFIIFIALNLKKKDESIAI